MPRPFDFALTLIHSGDNKMTFKRPNSAGLTALAILAGLCVLGIYIGCEQVQGRD